MYPNLAHLATSAPATRARNMFEANLCLGSPNWWRRRSSFSDWDNCDQLQRDVARVWIHSNRFGCGAANRESSIVLPSVCACVCGCASLCVFARVCVKICLCRMQNINHMKERNSHTKQIIFSVYNKKNSAEMAKTKIESALKMLNLFIVIPANRDSHWSRRGAARSEENLFICHRDWSDSIDCLIDLFLHLICDARAATRNVTGASASSSTIDRVFNSSWSRSEVVFCVWNLKKLPPSTPLSLSSVRSCAAPGQQLCWFVYRATSSFVWRNQIDRRCW